MSLLLEVDHQVPEGLVVGRRQQHQHFMDRFQPLICVGDFWEEHTEGVTVQTVVFKFAKMYQVRLQMQGSLMSSCNFRSFACVLPHSRKGLRLGTPGVLKVPWVGGGRLDPVLAPKESADAYCEHKLGFAQLLLNGGNARNLTVTGFNLNQISLGSVPLKLPN